MDKKEAKKHGLAGMQVFITYYAVQDVMAEALEERQFMQKEVKFDSDGNIVQEIQYTPEGEESMRIEQVFDGAGNLVEKKVWDHGEQTEVNTYEYNDDQKLIAEKLHYLDGSFDVTFLEYENGLLVGKRFSDDEGVVEGRETRKLENEKPVEIIRYDEDDEIVERVVISYHTNGEVLQRSKYDDTDDRESNLVNIYNGEGQLIAQEHFSNYQEDEVVRKELRYDDQARHVGTVALDEDGEAEMELVVVYNADGIVEREEEGRYVDGNFIITLKREFKYLR